MKTSPKTILIVSKGIFSLASVKIWELAIVPWDSDSAVAELPNNKFVSCDLSYV